MLLYRDQKQREGIRSPTTGRERFWVGSRVRSAGWSHKSWVRLVQVFWPNNGNVTRGGFQGSGLGNPRGGYSAADGQYLVLTGFDFPCLSCLPSSPQLVPGEVLLKSRQSLMEPRASHNGEASTLPLSYIPAPFLFLTSSYCMSPGWPWTWELPASPSLVIIGLQEFTTTPNLSSK